MAYLCFQFQHVVLALTPTGGDIWCEWRRDRKPKRNSVMIVMILSDVCKAPAVLRFGAWRLDSWVFVSHIIRDVMNRKGHIVSSQRGEITLQNTDLTTVHIIWVKCNVSRFEWMPGCLDGNIHCQFMSAGFTVDSGMLASSAQSWQTAAPQWRF